MAFSPPMAAGCHRLLFCWGLWLKQECDEVLLSSGKSRLATHGEYRHSTFDRHMNESAPVSPYFWKLYPILPCCFNKGEAPEIYYQQMWNDSGPWVTSVRSNVGEEELKLRGEARQVKGTMEINKSSLADISQKLAEVKSGGGCPCQGSNQTRLRDFGSQAHSDIMTWKCGSGDHWRLHSGLSHKHSPIFPMVSLTSPNTSGGNTVWLIPRKRYHVIVLKTTWFQKHLLLEGNIRPT